MVVPPEKIVRGLGSQIIIFSNKEAHLNDPKFISAK